jgi:hypothetical protein
MAGASSGMTTSMLRRCAPLALWALLMTTGAARAADPVYVQYACHLPNRMSAPVDGFYSEVTGTATVTNGCASNVGLSVELPDANVPLPSGGKWMYQAAPGTSVVSVELSRTARNISSEGRESRRSFWFGDSKTFLDSCELSHPCPETRHLTLTNSDQRFTLSSSCNSDPCFGPEAGSSLVSIDDVVITLRDEQPPALNAQPSGDLFNIGPVSGTRTVSVNASDVGGGVFTASLVVDGAEQDAHVLDLNGGLCAKPFTAAVPCKRTVVGQFSVDTTTLSEGDHVVKVVVRDVTGVNSVASSPTTIEVRNLPRPFTGSATGGAVRPANQPPKGSRLLGRQFRAGSVHQSFGRPITLRGRLVDGAHNPVANAELAVFSTPDVPRAKSSQIGLVRTDPAGRLRFIIPRGPSRRIDLRSASNSWTVKVNVSAPIRLQPSRGHLRNKQKLILVAYLLGAKAPAGSADIAFQVRIGQRWRTFATRPIGRDGRARIGHRFRVTYQSMTYRFRAIVVRRRTFPFAGAVSPPIAIRVN